MLGEIKCLNVVCEMVNELLAGEKLSESLKNNQVDGECNEVNGESTGGQDTEGG